LVTCAIVLTLLSLIGLFVVTLVSSNISFEDSIVAPLIDFRGLGYKTSVAGYSHVKHVQFTDIHRHLYEKVFKLFDNLGLNYFVFAGALVGYVRNGELPPWMDDMDVMIFEEDIEDFENRIVPILKDCGLACRPVSKKFEGAGYHILGLQVGKTRDTALAFSQDQTLTIPWFQVDIFYSTKVDQLAKNRSGWGLYHNKAVSLDWIFPGQRISMNGIEFPTFSQIEKDVEAEYGDVSNNIIIKTHGKTFLQASGYDFNRFIQTYREILIQTSTLLPPGVSRHDLSAYSGASKKPVVAAGDQTFEQIIQAVVQSDSSVLVLKSGSHIFWCMDLKRIFPGLRVKVTLKTVRDVKNAILLSDFIDEVKSPDASKVQEYESCLATLNRYLC